MGGESGIHTRMGFSFLMAYVILNLSSAGTRSVDNMSAYAAMTSSHNLALAGANVALAKLYRDTTWGTASPSTVSQTFTGIPFNGTFSATASSSHRERWSGASRRFPPEGQCTAIRWK